MATEPREPSPFGGLLGLEHLSSDPEAARARIEVRDELKQPFGYLHGGVITAMVEEVCSRATAVKVVPQGMSPLGQSLEVSLLRSITEGGLTVTARARHRGRSTWVWEVEAVDDEDRLCAIGKMTIAIRPRQNAKNESGGDAK